MPNEILEKRVMEFPRRAGEIAVVDQPGLSLANDFLLAAKAMQKEIAATFDPLIKAAHDSHVAILAAKGKFMIPLDAAEKAVKAKISAYLIEQDRIRRDAERKAQEAEWERQRQVREQREREERALAEAMALDAEGKKAEATKIIEQAAAAEKESPPPAPAPIKIPEAPKTVGISTREDWDFEIVDPEILPREFLIPDEIRIRKVVKAMKQQTKIPGVRVFSRQILSARG